MSAASGQSHDAAAAAGGSRADTWLAVLGWVLVLTVAVVGIGTKTGEDRVFHSTDQLYDVAPFRDALPVGYTPSNPWFGDTVNANMPQVVQARQRLLEGDFPDWNPYIAGGTPLMAVPGFVSVSPFGLPLLLAPSDLATAVTKLWEVLLTALGCFLFARRLGLDRAPATLVGLAYSFSGFMVVWTNWQHTRVAAAIPFLFWAVERALQLRRPRDVVPVALAVGSMLADGFPAVAALGIGAALTYAVVRSLADRVGTTARVLVVGSGVLLGTMLLAWQLVPFADYYAGNVDVEGRQQTSDRHLPLSALVTVLAPLALGSEGGGGDWWGGGLNEVESISYAGGAVLLLATVGLLSWGRVRGLRAGAMPFLVVGTGVLFVLVYVGGPLLAAVQLLPVLSSNYIGRGRVLLGLHVAVLAGVGAQQLLRGGRDPGALRRRVPAAAVLVALAVGLAVVATLRLRPEGELGDRAVWSLLVPVGGTVVALLAVLWRVRHGSARYVATGTVACLAALQAGAFTLAYWPSSPREAFYPVTSTHAFLRDHLGGDRFMSVGWTMMDGTASAYRLRSVEGHTFHDPRYLELLREVDPTGATVSPTYSVLLAEDVDAVLASPALDRAAARFAVLDPETPPLCEQEVASPPDGAVPWTDGQTLTFPDQHGPLRGVGVQWAQEHRFAASLGRVDVRVTDSATGRLLAQGHRRVYGAVGVGPWIVPLAGEELQGPYDVQLTLVAPGDTTTVLSGADGATLFRCLPRDDGLRLAHAGGAVVYERLGSLPRIRWASSAEHVGGTDARLAALQSGSRPDDTVLLGPAAGDDGHAAVGRPSGGVADVRVLRDDPERIEVSVDAAEAGWLVVADTLQQSGWSASVDGTKAPLLPADHAFVAVEVPQGQHTVAVRYQPPGREVGLAVSAAAVVVLAGLALLGRPADRRSRPSSWAGPA